MIKSIYIYFLNVSLLKRSAKVGQKKNPLMKKICENKLFLLLQKNTPQIFFHSWGPGWQAPLFTFPATSSDSFSRSRPRRLFALSALCVLHRWSFCHALLFPLCLARSHTWTRGILELSTSSRPTLWSTGSGFGLRGTFFFLSEYCLVVATARRHSWLIKM